MDQFDYLKLKRTKGVLDSLVTATKESIRNGGGIGWDESVSGKKLQEYWLEQSSNPLITLFIELRNGEVLGAVKLVQYDEVHAAVAIHRAEVSRFFVRPNARRNGVGRALMEALIQEAREKGLLSLSLDVRETQGPAINLYKNLGFKQYGRLDDYAYVNGIMYAGLYMYLVL